MYSGVKFCAVVFSIGSAFAVFSARGDTFMHPLVNFRSKPHGAVGTERYPSGKISLFFHSPEMGSAVWHTREHVG